MHSWEYDTIRWYDTIRYTTVSVSLSRKYDTVLGYQGIVNIRWFDHTLPGPISYQQSSDQATNGSNWRHMLGQKNSLVKRMLHKKNMPTNTEPHIWAPTKGFIDRHLVQQLQAVYSDTIWYEYDTKYDTNTKNTKIRRISLQIHRIFPTMATSIHPINHESRAWMSPGLSP